MATVTLTFRDTDPDDPHNFARVELDGQVEDGEASPGHASQQLAAVAMMMAGQEARHLHEGGGRQLGTCRVIWEMNGVPVKDETAPFDLSTITEIRDEGDVSGMAASLGYKLTVRFEFDPPLVPQRQLRPEPPA